MSLVDHVLPRERYRHVTFPSPLGVLPCSERKLTDSNKTGLMAAGDCVALNAR